MGRFPEIPYQGCITDKSSTGGAVLTVCIENHKLEVGEFTVNARQF